IGANSFLSGSGSSGNLVQIFMGNSAPVPVAGTMPANVTTVTKNSGHVFFGTKSITAASPTNTITANGASVLFGRNSTASDIKLGGGVSILAASFALLNSLDLSNPVVAQSILAQQIAGS